MKLFVWEDCLKDYTSGIMFALANTVESARENLKQQYGGTLDDALKADPKVYPVTKPVCYAVWGGA